MNWLNHNILSVLIWLPMAGALLLALLPKQIAKAGAILIATINFVLSLHLWWHWFKVEPDINGFRFSDNLIRWLPAYHIDYHLGVDGLSIFLVLLTTFLTPLVLLASWNSVRDRGQAYGICFLLLSAAAIGVFTALDAILFYIFWEAVLIPIYLIVGIWGGPRRVHASIKFFIYTMLGSVLMWIAMLYLYFRSPNTSFEIVDMRNAAHLLYQQDPGAATWLFLAFALAFAIKAPLFPFHTWLPETYTEAPIGGTVMLASVLSKMGAYGFLRLALPFFPDVFAGLAPLFIALAVFGIVYGALVAVMQKDMKRLIAYSSISHLGFIMLGIFAGFAIYRMNDNTSITMSSVALSGASLQMFNHGIATGALFLLVGFLGERRGTREIDQFGGLAKVMPTFTILFWIALFASIGLPGLNGFVGEYLILQGSMGTETVNHFWFVAAAATGVILGAVYMLRMFGSVMFGELTRDENRAAWDVNKREFAVMAVMLAIAIWGGVAPQPFLDIINPEAITVAAPSEADMIAAPVTHDSLIMDR